jgi:hypothetical protein
MWWRKKKRIEPEDETAHKEWNEAVYITIREPMSIQSRLAAVFPSYSQDQLATLEAIAKRTTDSLGEVFEALSERDGIAWPEYEAFCRSAKSFMPWLSDHNISSQYSQYVHALQK